MAFNNGGAAPKISKSFLLGWSDEPFKKPKAPPPPPPQPKPSGVPLATEVIEWIASDGRKGKLKGPVNLSLSKGPVNQANLDKSPEKGAGKTKKRRHTHQSINPAPPGTMDRVHGTLSKLHGTPAKLHATPAPADINAGLWAAFGNLGGGNTPVQQPTQPAAAVPEANARARSPAAAAGGDNLYSFTTAQDAELLRRKTENESWAVIGEALGKPKHELQERFKQIKPADWKPKPAETGKNKNKNKGGKEKKQEEKKEPVNETSGADNGGGDNIWGADWNYGAPDATAQPDQTENAWNKDNSKWESKSNKSASKKRGSAAGRNNNNNNGWSGQPGNTAHTINDVYPDDTFSMDDLALIARLLKRDHKQVWFRLSCAFKDKTGRYIPEEVFRKKLTGQSGK